MSAKNNKDKKKNKTKQAIVQPGTTSNFVDMLHLLTISLARPGLLNFHGDTVTIVT